MNYLNKAFEFIRETDSADFEGEKSEELIVKAETYLGLAFPDEYKNFLREFGCGDLNGIEIFGLINDKFESNSIPDAIAITSKERRDSNLNTNFLLIANSSEYYYALDLRKGSEFEVRVVEIIPSEKISEYPIAANSFGEFLCKQFDIL